MDTDVAVIDAAHLARQRAFSERTFGPGARTAGLVDHIRKELAEIEADPSDVSEWVDVIILAIAATGADVREVFETAGVPVRDRIAMECLAAIGDLDGDTVVLYAGTKGGQAASLMSAVRDRFEVAEARERALDRLVRGHRYSWEH